MYALFETKKFKKDLKKIAKRSKTELNLCFDVMDILQTSGVEGIPLKMIPHKLSGNFNEHWECHIKHDLLIIWLQFESPKSITLIRVGTHAELFK